MAGWDEELTCANGPWAHTHTERGNLSLSLHISLTPSDSPSMLKKCQTTHRELGFAHTHTHNSTFSEALRETHKPKPSEGLHCLLEEDFSCNAFCAAASM